MSRIKPFYISDKPSFQKEDYVYERSMTSKERQKEKRLRNKFDDSEMKANFIQQYGPEKGKQIYYFAYIRKQAMQEALELEEEFLDEAKQNREQRRMRRQISNERRKIQLQQRKKPKIFAAKKPKKILSGDLDDTLGFQGVEGRPDTPINVINKAGEVINKLNNQEYNAHKQEKKLKPGEKYDYSDFRDVPTLERTATWNKRLKSQLKRLLRRRSTRNSVHLTSARGRMKQGTAALQAVLAKQGIKIPAKNIHLTGDMRGGDTAGRKVTTNRGIAHIHQNRTGVRPIVTAIDDFKPTLDAHRKANQQESGGRSRGGSRRPHFKAEYVGPYKKGGVMPKPHRPEKAMQEDFELWIDELLYEGYDLSDITLEELEGIYLDAFLGESYEDERLFKSPYSEIMSYDFSEEEINEELTPYEYWKNYIVEDVEDYFDEDDEEYDEELDENYEPTSYEIWRAYLGEKYINEQEEEEEQQQLNPVGTAVSNYKAYRTRQAKRELLNAVGDIETYIRST